MLSSVARVVAGSVAFVAVCGSAATALATDPARIGMVEIKGSPAEQPHPLAWLLGEGDRHTLRTLVTSINDAADDDSLAGLVIRLKDAELNRTQIEELGSAIGHVRASGKKVHVFAEMYGPEELELGSFADEVLAQDGGVVSLPGLHMEEMFLADTLSWIGVKADLVQIGDYKGANEMFTRDKPSPAWDQNISQLLDSLYANMRAPILHGRRLDDRQLDTAMESAWMMDADQAVDQRLVDAAIDLPDLGKHLEKEYGAAIAWDNGVIPTEGEMKADMSNPFAMMSLLSKEPPRHPASPTIAVIHIDGTIVDGDSHQGGLMSGSSVGSRTIRNALGEAMDEEQVKGVVIRIDSPGGSATASEIIWQGVRRVAAKKPVWVSVGSMAASGGYYIAVSGDKIYVNPSSIVGSIGVVGGKITMGGLYDTLKVHITSRSRGPRAGMFDSTSAWTDAEKGEVRERMKRTYDLFTRRVKAGREGIDLSKTAEGRLFTGDKAIGMHMADKVGGLDDAIKDLAQSLHLESYDVTDYPGPKSIGEMIQDMLGQYVRSPMVRAPAAAGQGVGAGVGQGELVSLAREVVGEKAMREVRRAWAGLGELREEHVVLMSPRVLIWK